MILAVVEAPSPEFASAASAKLVEKLIARHQAFRFGPLARTTASSSRKTACCSFPKEEVAQVTGEFASAAPLIEIMAGDPSLRGLTGALETGLQGVKRGEIKLDSTARRFR